jgi:hypothetical protein
LTFLLSESLLSPPKQAVELAAPVARLFGTPSIIQGECLSGWLYRVAYHHRLDVKLLLRRIGIRSTTNDLDFGNALSQENVDGLSSLTMIAADRISAAKSHIPLLASKLFRCLTTDENGTPIYRVCCECLKEDSVAHIRHRWRLAYTLVCERHQQPLVRNCPHCRHRLDFSCLSPAARTLKDRANAINFCPRCFESITLLPHEEIDIAIWKRLLGFQTGLHQIVRLGWFKHPRFGTISAAKALENYLTKVTEEHDDGSYSVRFGSLDFRRCFGVHADDIIATLSA